MKTILPIAAVFTAGTVLYAGLAMSLALPALADARAAGENGFRFPFRYARSDLATVEGADRVVARLERAVRERCADTSPRPLDQRSAVDACVRATMKASIAKFHSPTIAQAYQSRSES